MKKQLNVQDIIAGESLSLRFLTLDDCNTSYLDWLNNSAINYYLETRFHKQSISSIKEFVSSMLDSDNNYLFAIIENNTQKHIGNIKLGPINFHHLYADISYFIGETSAWGKGYATEAIRMVCHFGFEKLSLHSIQAGVYENNIGSIKALEKVGFVKCACIKEQLKTDDAREDHLLFNLLQTQFY